MDSHVRVLVADDHPSVRENLRYLVDAEPDLVCVGVAKDGPSTVRLCQELVPQVLVLDDDMPGADGLRVLKHLRREMPDVAVIVYTLDPEVSQAARTYGAVSCVLKDTRYEVLIRAIREAAPSTVLPSELH